MSHDDDLAMRRSSGGNTVGCRLPVDPALRHQGWEWRCNIDGTKLHQVTDSYRELGFEVYTEPLNVTSLCDSCAGCRDSLVQASAVFVRRKT